MDPSVQHQSIPRRTFRCLIIGEGTLPLRCGDILLSRGHDVVAIATLEQGAAHWAVTHGVELTDPRGNIASTLGGRPVDYVFSIVNPAVLTPAVLALPLIGAINYHDALLPRYAGVHATTWAIMAGETQHGVTWHEVADRVDAGRILKQRCVEIAATDTAFTLNTKCYEAASESFVELVDELERGCVVPRLQDLSQRSYFGRYKRPPIACVIDWNQPAAVVDAFFRSLDFGDYPNPLGRPKFFLNGAAFVCRVLRILPDDAAAQPGTITRIDSDGIVIATRDQLVRIQELFTLEGDPVAPAEVLMRHGLRVGDLLHGPSAEVAARIDALNRTSCREEEFWAPRLVGLTPPALPDVDARSAQRDTNTQRERHPVRVPGGFSDRVAGGDGVAALLAAFAVYLARIGNGESFDIGVDLAGERASRRDAGALFAMQVPLRLSPDLSQPFSIIAREVRGQIDQLAHHGTFAWDLLSRHPVLKRDSGQRLYGRLPIAAAVCDFTDETAPGDSAQLTLMIARDGRSAQIAFDPDFISHSVVDRIVTHLETLMKDAVVRPELAAARLQLLDATERRLVIEEWNNTATEYARDGTIAQLFERWVKLTPNAIAIEGEDRVLTYAELNVRANQLAHWLQGSGVGPDVPVALCVERSPDMVVAILAIVKAGGAYVPLDPAYPRERLKLILADSGAKVLIAHSHLITALQDEADAELGLTVLLLDTNWGSVAEASRDTPVCSAHAESLAYIMYTSGSTGVPKGVSVMHRGVVRLVSNTGYAHFGPEEVSLCFAPFAFDVSTFEIWGALLNGGRLAVFPSHLPTPDELGEFIERRGVTTLWLTTALFHQMVDVSLPRLRGVRQLLAGGDVLSPAHVRRLMRDIPHCRMINGYGPTENTTFTSCYTVPSAWLDERADTSVPIGRPIANTTVYVLGAHHQPMPIGVTGRLYTGGDGVARGYINDAALTAERFIPDPFSGGPGARLYDTGDLAYWRPDGVLEFVGRRDNQVKLRGYRIELGEIEAQLVAFPGVRAAAVLAREDSPDDKRLVAYLTGDDIEINIEELRAHLTASLPEYMVPAAYVRLDALPLTRSGKLDRKSLPAPDRAAYVNSGYEAPQGEGEKALAEIWAEVLKLERVGRRDNFFELGGHSLHAASVLGRVAETLQVRLPLRALFEAPTITQFGDRVAAAGRDAADRDEHDTVSPGEVSAIPRRHRSEAPLSRGQEVLWLLQHTSPELAAYNVPEQWRISGAIDADVLQRALDTLIERHETLRTTFVGLDSGPVQLVGAARSAPFEQIDLTQLPSAERNADAAKLVRARVRAPFDLAADVLLRATLIRIADEEYVFLLVLHHVAYDGWSRSTLIEQLSALYSGIAAGVTPRIDLPPITYADFATSQHEGLPSSTVDGQLEYWRERLGGVHPTVYVPTDRPRSGAPDFDGAVATVTFSPALVGDLSRLAQAHGATLFMVLLAAFQALLHRYSGEREIVVGTADAGRFRPELEKIVGYFVNTVPILTSFAGDPTFLELVARVRGAQLGATEHADVSLEQIIAELSRGESVRSLFQVMFVLQNNSPALLRLGDALIQEIPINIGTAKFDLSFETSETMEGLKCAVEYRTALFDADTIDRLLASFGVLLAGIAQAPDARVSRLPLLTDAERRHIIRDWNTFGTPSDYEYCVHELVEAQAHRTPGAIAVVGESGSSTYSELNARANRLARDLSARGVGPDVLVGVCLERSLDLVIALLAVLKAGGAYVPLDPDYPSERLAFMLADCGAPVLVTSPPLSDRLPVHSTATVHIDSAYWNRPDAANPPDDLGMRCTPDNLAYVMYTSGSTGRPKGAMNTHGGVCNFLLRSREVRGYGPTDVVLGNTPASFDTSVVEIFGSLTSGACLMIARPGGHADPTYLCDLIAERRVTVVYLVPSMLQALLDVPAFQSRCATLRIVACGGEALALALQECFFTLSAATLHNAYGPTETSVCVCDWRCERGSTRHTVPLGRPLSNVQIYILDTAGEPTPIGVPGELHIGGAGVGRGYLNQSQLTSEYFVPDTLSGNAGRLMYKTGDVARFGPDGVIEYLGRRDHQLKLRGVRIELGEIEVALAAHQSVREAVVIVREDQRDDVRLVAYVVLHAGVQLPERELREHLQRILIVQMIPSAFVLLATLPLTPSGKIDRRALPAPMKREADVAEQVAARTPTEEVLVRTWGELLRCERVGVHDNFFELGGHSLVAMRLVSRAQMLGIQLSVRSVFELPTIAQLAAFADGQTLSGASSPTQPAITRVARVAYRRPPVL